MLRYITSCFALLMKSHIYHTFKTCSLSCNYNYCLPLLYKTLKLFFLRKDTEKKNKWFPLIWSLLLFLRMHVFVDTLSTLINNVPDIAEWLNVMLFIATNCHGYSKQTQFKQHRNEDYNVFTVVMVLMGVNISYLTISHQLRFLVIILYL